MRYQIVNLLLTQTTHQDSICELLTRDPVTSFQDDWMICWGDSSHVISKLRNNNSMNN